MATPAKRNTTKALKICYVYTCSNNNLSNRTMTFLRLPDSKNDRQRLEDWLMIIGRPDMLKYEPKQLASVFVCSSHFHPSEVHKYQTNKHLLPTLNLPHRSGAAAVITKPAPAPDAEPVKAPVKQAQKKSSIQIYNYFAKNLNLSTHPHSIVNFKNYCMHLYQCSALQYKIVQSSLKLLPLNALRRHCRLAAAAGELAGLLELRAPHMSLLQRGCTLCLASAPLKPSFYYNTRLDRLVGVAPGAGKAARVAVVAVLSGLLSDWHLPLAHKQLKALEPPALAAWLDEALRCFPRGELALHAIVAPLEPAYYYAAQLRGLTDYNPYITYREYKVCFYFYPKSIMENVCYYLKHSNITFKDKKVKWDHLVQYFDFSRSLKMDLTPGLTASDLESGGTAVLSRGVARAISVLAQLGKLPADAAHTADFLAGVNDLLDLCTSQFSSANNPLKRPFSGEEIQKQNLKDCNKFLDNIILVKHKSNWNVNAANFVNAFRINIMSIRELHNDLKIKNIESLPTRRLGNSAEIIIKQIQATIERNAGKLMTAQNFMAAFNKVFVMHYMQPSNLSVSKKNIEMFLKILEVGLDSYKPAGGVLVGQPRVEPVVVSTSCYRQLRLPKSRPARYLAGFLLATCLNQHQNCQKQRNFYQECCVPITSKLEDGYRIKNLIYLLPADREYVVEPPKYLLKFLQQMEDVFVSAVAQGLAEETMAQLEASTAGLGLRQPHCSCFPVYFLKVLFMRVRLFLTLKHNNAALRRGEPRHSFSSEGLEFVFHNADPIQTDFLGEEDTNPNKRIDLSEDDTKPNITIDLSDEDTKPDKTIVLSEDDDE